MGVKAALSLNSSPELCPCQTGSKTTNRASAVGTPRQLGHSVNTPGLSSGPLERDAGSEEAFRQPGRSAVHGDLRAPLE